jgi:hypothetical protein
MLAPAQVPCLLAEGLAPWLAHPTWRVLGASDAAYVQVMMKPGVKQAELMAPAQPGTKRLSGWRAMAGCGQPRPHSTPPARLLEKQPELVTSPPPRPETQQAAKTPQEATPAPAQVPSCLMEEGLGPPPAQPQWCLRDVAAGALCVREALMATCSPLLARLKEC